MKKLLLSMLLFVSAHTILAQQKPLIIIDSVKDRMENNGYTIQLKTAPGNTVLFDLLQGGSPVFRQPMNPVTRLPFGFATKQDAFKVAVWMIGQYGKQGHFPPILPPGVAQQLNLQNTNLHPSPIN